MQVSALPSLESFLREVCSPSDSIVPFLALDVPVVFESPIVEKARSLPLRTKFSLSSPSFAVDVLATDDERLHSDVALDVSFPEGVTPFPSPIRCDLDDDTDVYASDEPLDLSSVDFSDDPFPSPPTIDLPLPNVLSPLTTPIEECVRVLVPGVAPDVFRGDVKFVSPPPYSLFEDWKVLDPDTFTAVAISLFDRLTFRLCEHTDDPVFYAPPVIYVHSRLLDQPALDRVQRVAELLFRRRVAQMAGDDDDTVYYTGCLEEQIFAQIASARDYVFPPLSHESVLSWITPTLAHACKLVCCFGDRTRAWMRAVFTLLACELQLFFLPATPLVFEFDDARFSSTPVWFRHLEVQLRVSPRFPSELNFDRTALFAYVNELQVLRACASGFRVLGDMAVSSAQDDAARDALRRHHSALSTQFYLAHHADVRSFCIDCHQRPSLSTRDRCESCCAVQVRLSSELVPFDKAQSAVGEGFYLAPALARTYPTWRTQRLRDLRLAKAARRKAKVPVHVSPPSYQPVLLPLVEDSLYLALETTRVKTAWCICNGLLDPANFTPKSRVPDDQRFTARQLRDYSKLFTMLSQDEGQAWGTDWIVGPISRAYSFLADVFKSAVAEVGRWFGDGVLTGLFDKMKVKYDSFVDFILSARDRVVSATSIWGFDSILELVLAAICGTIVAFTPAGGLVTTAFKLVMSMITGFFSVSSVFHFVLALISKVKGGDVATDFDRLSSSCRHHLHDGIYHVHNMEEFVKVLACTSSGGARFYPIRLSLRDETSLRVWNFMSLEAADQFYKALLDDVPASSLPEPVSWFGEPTLPQFIHDMSSKVSMFFDSDKPKLKPDSAFSLPLSTVYPVSPVLPSGPLPLPVYREESPDAPELKDVRPEPVIDFGQASKLDKAQVGEGGVLSLLADFFTAAGFTVSPVSLLMELKNLQLVFNTFNAGYRAIATVVSALASLFRTVVAFADSHLVKWSAYRRFRGVNALFDRAEVVLAPIVADPKALAVEANVAAVLALSREVFSRKLALLKEAPTSSELNALNHLSRTMAPIVDEAEIRSHTPARKPLTATLFLLGESQIGKSAIVAPLIGKAAYAKHLKRPLLDSEMFYPTFSDSKFPFAGYHDQPLIMADDMWAGATEELVLEAARNMMLLGGAQATAAASAIADLKGNVFLTHTGLISTENSPQFRLLSKILSYPQAVVNRMQHVYQIVLVGEVDGVEIVIPPTHTHYRDFALSTGLSAVEIERRIRRHYRFLKLTFKVDTVISLDLANPAGPTKGYELLDFDAIVDVFAAALAANQASFDAGTQVFKNLEFHPTGPSVQTMMKALGIPLDPVEDAPIHPKDIDHWDPEFARPVAAWIALQKNPAYVEFEIRRLYIDCNRQSLLFPTLPAYKRFLAVARKLLDQAKSKVSPVVSHPLFLFSAGIVAVAGITITVFKLFSSSDDEDEAQSYDVRTQVTPSRTLVDLRRRRPDTPQLSKSEEERWMQIRSHYSHIPLLRVMRDGAVFYRFHGILADGLTIFTSLHNLEPVDLDDPRLTLHVSLPDIDIHYSFLDLKIHPADSYLTSAEKAELAGALKDQGLSSSSLVDFTVIVLPQPIKGVKKITRQFVAFEELKKLTGAHIVRIAAAQLKPHEIRTEQTGKVLGMDTIRLNDTQSYPFALLTDLPGHSGFSGSPVAITTSSINGVWGGIHAAEAVDGSTKVQMIWRELAERILDDLNHIEPDTTILASTTVPFDHAQLEVACACPVPMALVTDISRAIVTSPPKHDFIVSPAFHSLPSELQSDRLPSVLKPVYQKPDGSWAVTWGDNLEVIMAKENHMFPPPGMDEYLSFFLSRLTWYKVKSYLSLYEALNGNSVLPGIDPAASAGTMGLPDKRSKREWVNISPTGEKTPTPEAQVYFDASWRDFEEMRSRATITTASLKSEPLPPEKIEERKTRRFFPQSFDDSVTEKRIFGGAVTLLKMNFPHLNIMVGANSKHLQLAASDLYRFKRAAYFATGQMPTEAGDDAIKNDLSMPLQTMIISAATLMAINEHLDVLDGVPSEQRTLRRRRERFFLFDQACLIVAMCVPVRCKLTQEVSPRWVLFRAFMNGSGRWLTTEINSVSHDWQVFGAWRLLYPTDPLAVDVLRSRLWYMIYSDDGFLCPASHEPAKWLDAMNQTVGPLHRSDGKNFIGRHPLFVDGKLRFVLSMDAIKQMLSYVSRKGEVWLNFRLNVECALRELALHGRLVFEKYAPILNQILMRKGLAPVSTTLKEVETWLSDM